MIIGIFRTPGFFNTSNQLADYWTLLKSFLRSFVPVTEAVHSAVVGDSTRPVGTLWILYCPTWMGLPPMAPSKSCCCQISFCRQISFYFPQTASSLALLLTSSSPSCRKLMLCQIDEMAMAFHCESQDFLCSFSTFSPVPAEEEFFSSSFCPSICALGLISRTLLCYQVSLLSPVYLITLSNSLFHQQWRCSIPSISTIKFPLTFPPTLTYLSSFKARLLEKMPVFTVFVLCLLFFAKYKFFTEV